MTTHPELWPVSGAGPWPSGGGSPAAGLLAKHLLDRIGAALLLLLVAPLMLAVAVAIRLEDGGPVLLRRTRVGQHGRPFTMLGFRSTVLDEGDGGVGGDEGLEPRPSRVGAELRRYSLDELPQLVNVLAGRMSLVGPRPLAPHEVARYGRDAQRRLLVRPGLTGPGGTGDRGGPSWEETVRLDLRYVEEWSLDLDARILGRAIGAVLGGRGPGGGGRPADGSRPRR